MLSPFSCPVAHSFSLRPHLSLRPRFLLALLPHLKRCSLLLKEYFPRGLLLPHPPSTIILIHYSYYFPCCITLQSSFFPSFSTKLSISFPFPSFSKLRRPSRTVSPLVNHRFLVFPYSLLLPSSSSLSLLYCCLPSGRSFLFFLFLFVFLFTYPEYILQFDHSQ